MRPWFRLRTNPFALFLALSLLSACDLPKTPEELTKRFVQAAMNGDEQALSPLLAPDGEAKALSARALRLKYQGLGFRAVEEPSTDSNGAPQSAWFFDVSISGTERYVHAARMLVDCKSEPTPRCQLTSFSELPWSLPELKSVEDELESADSQPRVWLMTSLDVLDPQLNFFTGRNRLALAKAEAMFQRWALREARHARAVIAHLATQDDLARVLKDPRTLALFWLSHGNQDTVIDYRGFDLTPVWKQFGKESQAARLALISCQSRGILPPTPQIIDFENKIDMLRALGRSLKTTRAADLKRADLSLHSNTAPESPGPQETIQLVRKLRSTPLMSMQSFITPAVRVETRDKILFTIPGKRAFETSDSQQTVEIQVPLLINQVTLTAGQSLLIPLQEIEIGEWQILTPGWKFFADALGKPIGVTRQILLRNTNP
ncbi:hypothetical protein EBZ37_04350 [bacterium]|nr:hypothetical protein [bacterium]